VRLSTSTIDPAAATDFPSCALAGARHKMMTTGQWNAAQLMGRRWPIGCVALEITQRCNLDCTACYLSESSEAVHDLPLEEVFRRIDMIYTHYGPDTDVQVTGGDPTLRRRSELIEIVRRTRDKGMRPTSFTNGLRATRDLLDALTDAGLMDVAFHVDMTQQRRGFDSEIALNALRRDYINRARGLGLSIFFNTTVFAGNLNQIPEIVRFFVRNADAVSMASFQLQADTGRGVLGVRAPRITIDSVKQQITLGADAPLSFETIQVGHSQCNRSAMAFVTNARVYDMLDNRRLVADIVETTSKVRFDRQNHAALVRAFVTSLLAKPSVFAHGLVWLIRKIWLAKADLLATRGKVHKLSFFIHNFMDACAPDQNRVDACTFVAITSEGPISMCLHNARRDAFILKPMKISGAVGEAFWNPLSGKIEPSGSVPTTVSHSPKTARGRLKALGANRRPGPH
jgi:uncharacterized radical SAM superfamily Fe-S cluster-containing enzyme